MKHRAIWLAIILFLLIVTGMFMYAHLERTQQTPSPNAEALL